MSRITKASNPELFCAYEHCNRRLSKAQLSHNAIKDEFFDLEHKARYCSRRHKELAAQQRRRLQRRADAARAAGDAARADELLRSAEARKVDRYA
jgi:hypothetical protein